MRNESMSDPMQWLTKKATQDGAEELWRIHNGLYDLTNFMKSHPGGEEWLELSKGLDITEAFESHHFNPAVEKTLAKYYVRDAKTARNSPFTFNDDGFYRTLKREVVEELKKVPLHAPKYADMVTDGLFVTLLASSTMACWVKNYWFQNVFYIIASFALSWVIVAAHNYVHRKSNWRMYLFNLSLWSYRDFRVSHVLSHHLYTSTLMDLEVGAFEPLLSWTPRRNMPFIYKFVNLIEQASFSMFFIKHWTIRIIFILFRKDYYRKHFRWHDFIGILLPVWIWVVSRVSFLEAFNMWLWINCTASFIFMTVGSSATHHHPKIFVDEDQDKEPNLDWGIHEMKTVMDRTDINGNLFKVMTFFGDHCLHHLFPTLDHAVLPYLYPVFLKNCDKFRVTFQNFESCSQLSGRLIKTIINIFIVRFVTTTISSAWT